MIRRSPSVPAHRPAGFTLIEFLVGMAILAAAMLIVLPETRRAASGRTLDAAASDFAAVARMTRAAALLAGSERTLAVDPEARQYWAEGVAELRALPARTTMTLDVPPHIRSSEPPYVIRFPSGGGSSGARIVLDNGTRKVTVVIDWLTGGARVSH